ncbi:MAG TPA: DegT/DnrJ/EryC1/StrS family aminotransferase [Candidatus Limnocylindrales bacterium]|nr:DegT/DnrJ/EryC1/StrS family aminotransferase [Candidatus Limnocylindrales bacterium]
MSVRFWEPGKEFHRIETEVMDTMRDVLSKGDLIMRHQMEDFEHNLAAFVGTSDAVGVSNCTDGMRLLLEAVGIGPGDEVITVSHTFMATMAVIHQVGATPVLVDVGDDHNMNVDLVEAAITPRTKAIMPVYLNGRLVQMDRLMEIARSHELMVIEDTAQALGGAYLGVRGGAWGVAGAFSFYPAKLLGAYGDAGAVVTSDDQIAKRLRELRDHGRISKTGFSGWGWNCRLDNLQAAVLDLKLRKVPQWINERRRLAAIYDEELADVGAVKRPPGPDGGPFFDIYQNYVIEADRRDELAGHLAQKGIETLVSPGPIPNHKQPVGLDHFHLPRTEELCARVLSLPLNNELDESQVLEVAGAIKDFYS